MKRIAYLLLAAFSLQLSAFSVSSGAQVNLSWQDNATTEDGTTIERAPGLNATSGFVVIANPPATAAEKTGTGTRTFTDTSAAAATAYSYRVRSFNTGGASGFSNTASVTTLAAPPTNPGTLEAQPPAGYTPPTPTVTLGAGESLTVVASTAPVPAVESAE